MAGALGQALGVLGAGPGSLFFTNKNLKDSPIADFLFGSADKLEKVPTATKEQEQLHNALLAQAMGFGQGGGGFDLANQYYNQLLGPNQGEAYNQFAAPYLQQFQEQILPQIAERFAGMGALSSSGFGQALGGAASGLQSQLAKLFAELQGQAAQQQYGQYNQLFQTGLNYQPFGYYTKGGSQGILPSALGALGTAFGGGAGGAVGNAAGQGISNLFKGMKGGLF